MKTVFAFLTWLGVTLVEAGVFYAMWRWFVEGVFSQVPQLTYQDALGLIIAVRLFVPDQLMQKLTRDPGGGDPLLDLAWLRIKVAMFLFLIGCVVHFSAPKRKTDDPAPTYPRHTFESGMNHDAGYDSGVSLEDMYTP